MKIGNLIINDKAALAPMAGVADRAFRELCRSYGAAYTVCEMASAKGISLGDKKSAELLYISESERPAGSQIFGNSPETMAIAAISHNFSEWRQVKGNKFLPPIVSERVCSHCGEIETQKDMSSWWMTPLIVVVVIASIIGVVNYIKAYK